MSSKFGTDATAEENFRMEYQPDKIVKVIKKDGREECLSCADQIHG